MTSNLNFELKVLRPIPNYFESNSKYVRAGNTEQGNCRLTNEYPFFLFLIGRWYYEKNILSL